MLSRAGALSFPLGLRRWLLMYVPLLLPVSLMYICG